MRASRAAAADGHRHKQCAQHVAHLRSIRAGKLKRGRGDQEAKKSSYIEEFNDEQQLSRGRYRVAESPLDFDPADDAVPYK